MSNEGLTKEAKLQYIINRRNKLIEKLGLEKRMLLDIIYDNVQNEVVRELADRICSREKESK